MAPTLTTARAPAMTGEFVLLIADADVAHASRLADELAAHQDHPHRARRRLPFGATAGRARAGWSGGAAQHEIGVSLSRLDQLRVSLVAAVHPVVRVRIVEPTGELAAQQ
jgi:hypothetical protein